MYKIDAMHDGAIDAFFGAFKEGKRERWMAAFAWWFFRQHVSNAQEFWSKTAAKITVELPEADRAAVMEQLNKSEDLLVAQVESEWPAVPENLARYIAGWDPEPVVVNLEALREAAVAKVNREASAQRAQYLTTGVGMDLVYAKKLKEAEAKLANASIANDKIPHIVNEAEINGVTTTQMAQLVVDTEASWTNLSAPIEQKRMTAKKAIGEAETAEEIASAASVSW